MSGKFGNLIILRDVAKLSSRFAPVPSAIALCLLPEAQSRLPNNVSIQVNLIEKDPYGRTVAEIFLGETFINAEMVREGHAWHYERYSGNCPNRSAIVEAANNTQLTGIPPWEFRKGN